MFDNGWQIVAAIGVFGAVVALGAWADRKDPPSPEALCAEQRENLSPYCAALVERLKTKTGE